METWKRAVYEYIHNRNQLEVGYDVDAMLSTVRDDRYLRKQELRLKRLRLGHRERQARPTRNETGLVLRSVEEREKGEQVQVDVELRRTLEYELRGMTHTELRKERERLRLSRQGSRWLITSVEEEVPERLSGGSPPSEMLARAQEEEAYQAQNRQLELSRRSMPYLNPQLITSKGLDVSFRPVTYNRVRAQEYANLWWDGSNPNYASFEVDCTNFISQCLFAGGAPMNYTGRRETGWWYQGLAKDRELWSYSWAVANSLCTHLPAGRTGVRAELRDQASELTIGDVIGYDWDGNGRFQHTTIVTALDAAGMPLVNAHTVNSKHRYWDYKDSYAWTPNTKYRFCHILDQF